MQSSLSACSGASSPADGAAKLPGCRGKPIYQWLLPTDVFVLELLLLLTAVTLTLLTNWYRSVLTTTSASRLNVSAVSWEVIWSQGLPPEGGPCPGTLQLPAALPARSAHPLRLSKTLQTRASLNSLHLSFVATTAKLLGDALPPPRLRHPGPTSSPLRGNCLATSLLARLHVPALPQPSLTSHTLDAPTRVLLLPAHALDQSLARLLLPQTPSPTQLPTQRPHVHSWCAPLPSSHGQRTARPLHAGP